MSENKITYHVAYVYNDLGQIGFGCTQVHLEKQIQDVDDIKNLIKMLCKDMGFQDVGIMNFIKLEAKND